MTMIMVPQLGQAGRPLEQGRRVPIGVGSPRPPVPTGTMGHGPRVGGTVGELTCLEICAGAGGQSLGLEQAGFTHAATVELDPDACTTLRLNRPGWKIVEQDVHHFDGGGYPGVDLLAGGVPCPPFSIAGRQLGADDERDLFPQALRLVQEAKPAAVMLENVRGLASARFADYRQNVLKTLERLGYEPEWQVLNAS